MAETPLDRNVQQGMERREARPSEATVVLIVLAIMAFVTLMIAWATRVN